MDKKQILEEFKPLLRYYDIECLLGYSRMTEIKIKNNKIYHLVKKLTDKAFPTEDKYDKKWFNFYLPLKRSGCFVTLPFWVIKYKRDFFVGFQGMGSLHIKKGKERVEKEYKTIFKETLRFVPIIKETKNRILEKSIPYDIRTGKIKGRHILKRVMSKKEKKKILSDYENHLKKELKTPQTSLNEYLNTAAICYKAVYGKKAKNLSPLQMYKKWADGRDGGMLSIRNWDSKACFKNWYKGGRWSGSHPFEIVFSWHRHGIHLYPPSEYYFHNVPYYSLRVTNYAYAENFIRMVEALIKKEIPFQARDLKEVLDYLTGETYFTVNERDEHFIHYSPSKEYKKLFFCHIKWDEIKIPKWKKRK